MAIAMEKNTTRQIDIDLHPFNLSKETNALSQLQVPTELGKGIGGTLVEIPGNSSQQTPGCRESPSGGRGT
eukprot:7355378-Pyramimonas_sp.AAC.1